MKGRWIKFSCIFVAFIIFILSGMCYADSLTFGWDANSESDLKGYRLYRRIEGQAEYPVEAIVDNIPKDETSCECIIPHTEVTNYFVVRAFDDVGNESGNSNEVSYTPDATPPANPSGLNIIKIDVNIGIEMHITQ